MAELDLQPVLQGERLVLRPLQQQDWEALWPIANDRELWAMHPVRDRWQEPVFRTFFEDALEQGGALLVIERESGRAVGSSRFQAYRPEDGGTIEIGWTFLARDRWGSGLNAEMKRLMLAHAFGYLERVVFRVGEANWRSRRAMEKIGGRLTREIERIPADGGDIVHLIYEIRREDFEGGPLASHGGSS